MQKIIWGDFYKNDGSRDPVFFLLGAKYWTFDVLLSSWWFFEDFLYSPLGEDFQFDYMIFLKQGWNHQPANLWVVFLGETEKKMMFSKLGASEMHPSKKFARGELGLQKNVRFFWLNLSCPSFRPLWDDNYSHEN